MAVPKDIPCRLYVILAREAPVGVIFRRGPSRWVQIIKWDTATDTFTPGQWFHGRIYERRCDLSPNGNLLVYFAQKLNKRTMESDYTYAWTAVSKLPYLTALALWPKGNCWAGGGLFLDSRSLRLNHREGEDQPHRDHIPVGLYVTCDGGYGEDEPILLRRLEQDGWRYTQQLSAEYTRTDKGFVTHSPGIHRKQNPFGWQKLTMLRTVSGFRTNEDYSVRFAEGQEHQLAGAAWADWDQHGRLVYARDGRLLAASFTPNGPADEQELANFNDNEHEPMEAPG